MFENSETAIIPERRVSLTCTIKNIFYVSILENMSLKILLYFLLIVNYCLGPITTPPVLEPLAFPPTPVAANDARGIDVKAVKHARVSAVIFLNLCKTLTVHFPPTCFLK